MIAQLQLKNSITGAFYDPILEREELHPVCMMKGIITSQKTGMNVSGHSFIQVGGDNAFNAVLECETCQTASVPLIN